MSIFSLLTSVPGVSAREASELVDDGALIVDVREPQEWHAGHAPDAVHIPLMSFAHKAGALPKDRKIVVVCRSGNRSRAAVKALNDAGFDAVNLGGGMLAWTRAGLPFVSENGRPPFVA